MIGNIINGIMSFVISLITTILSPIDTYITNNIPVLSDALTSINSFIDYVISIIGYVVDASMLSTYAVLLVVSYYTFAIGTTFTFYMIKLCLKWYNALKL